MVKKEGKSQGRPFVACAQPQGNQCRFFMWLDVPQRKPSVITQVNQMKKMLGQEVWMGSDKNSKRNQAAWDQLKKAVDATVDKLKVINQVKKA